MSVFRIDEEAIRDHSWIVFVKSPKAWKVKTILLVDTMDHSRIKAKWFLGNLGYIVDSVSSAEEALVIFNSAIHDLVVTDYAMSGMNGPEMAHVLKLRSPHTPIILYSKVQPDERRCFDAVVRKQDDLLVESQLLLIKDAIDGLLAAEIHNHSR